MTGLIRTILTLCLAVPGSPDGPPGAAGATRAAPDPRDEPPRPNIVLILADDLGFSDVAPYGGEIDTPNLQALADAGLRLTQFYNTGRCCPTRASLLSGLYPHQAGVGHMVSDRGLDGYRGDLSPHCVTIAEVLRGAQYRTSMCGKWHVTRHTGYWSGHAKLTRTHNWPLQRGFDRFYGTIHGAGSYWEPVSLTDGNTPIRVEDDRTFYYTDAISDRASRFIREHDRRAPFFLYVAYTAPHWPLHAWPEDIAKYNGRYDDGWDAIRAERLARQRDMGIIDDAWALSDHDPRVPDWADAPHPAWQKRAMEVYAAMVDRMDQGIGRVLTALDDTGQADDTIVIFIADNGGCAEGGTSFDGAGYSGGLSQSVHETQDGTPVDFGHYATVMPGPADTFQEYGRPWANVSNTPFRLYKHFVHEGGISSPCIIRWPAGLDAHGALDRTPAHLIDLMPTFIELAGATYPAERAGETVTPLEGTSLAPLLRGAAIARTEPIFWEHEGNRAVRDGRWKLVARGRQGAWELYDMEADRTERHDLAAADPERVERMAARWQGWATRAQVVPWP